MNSIFLFDPEYASHLTKVGVAVLVITTFALSLRAIHRSGATQERAEFVSNLLSGGVVYLISTTTFVVLRQLADESLTGRGPWHVRNPMVGATLSFLIVDLASYAYHVIAHRTPMFWSFHVVHHSGRHFNLSLGPRQSWIERAFVTPLCYVLISIPICWGLNLSFWYLLLGHQLVYLIGFLNHTTVFERWPLGLDRLLINPIEHRIHHGIEVKHFDCNYGFALRVWDVLFRTYRAPDAAMNAIDVGVANCPYTTRALGVQGQTLTHLAVHATELATSIPRFSRAVNAASDQVC